MTFIVMVNDNVTPTSMGKKGGKLYISVATTMSEIARPSSKRAARDTNLCK